MTETNGSGESKPRDLTLANPYRRPLCEPCSRIVLGERPERHMITERYGYECSHCGHGEADVKPAREPDLPAYALLPDETARCDANRRQIRGWDPQAWVSA